MEKKKQGKVLTLPLPEGSKIRDKVFSEIDIDKLDKDDGLELLIKFFDKIYKQDALSAFEAWCDFDRFKKTETESMEDYIMEVEKLYSNVPKY